MKRKIIILCAIFTIAIFFCGCTNNEPIRTIAEKDGVGYILQLGAPSGRVPFGGKMALTGSIRDSNGDVVETSTHFVTFTSERGGEFAPFQTTIVDGIVQTIYVAPNFTLPSASKMQALIPLDNLPTSANVLVSDLPIIETITMNFLGASAKLRITIMNP